MEIFVAVLVAGAVLVCGPVSLVLAVRALQNAAAARRENQALRVRLDALDGARTPAGHAGREAAPGTAPPVPVPVPVPVSGPDRPAPPAAAPGAFEAVIGGQWLTWVGVLAIFFGTAFFLGYDLGESPLAGLGQILTGLAVAAVFLIAGRRLDTGPRRFLGLGLLGGGIALLYLAAYAAYAFHALIHVAAVYPFLLAVALVGSALTLARDSLAMAMLTLTGALLTPLLLQVSGDPGLLLFAYLAVVSAGAVLTAARRRWSVLAFTAFAGTVLLVLLWWDAHDGAGQVGVSLPGTAALWALYLVAPLFTERGPGFWSAARSLVVAANGFAFAAVLLALLGDRGNPERGGVLLGLAVVYLGASRWAARRGPSPSGSLTHYTGIALFAAAAPVLFDAGWVSVTWVAMGIALHAAGIRLRSGSHRVLGWILHAFAAGKLVTWDTYTLFDRSLPHVPGANMEFGSGLIVVAGLLVSFFLLRRHQDLLERWDTVLMRGSVPGAAVLLWFRLTTEIVAGFEFRHRATGESFELATLLTLSLSWALYAALLVAVGFWTRFRPLRLLGVVVLAVLVGKVFLLDLQELERGYRIASFVGVGLLLLAVSLLYQRERSAARERG